MQDNLLRAQHYLDLAAQMNRTAELEPDPVRQQQLKGLAVQYERLAGRLVVQHSDAQTAA
ncbi:MAG TPA: hypothetical protein VGL35_10470 [Rhizomicrobium sp.]